MCILMINPVNHCDYLMFNNVSLQILNREKNVLTMRLVYL